MPLAPLAPLALLFALAPLQPGDSAPALDLTALDGRRTVIDLRGGDQVTLVDFFATWCPHCRESVAAYPGLVRAFGDRLRIVVVDVGEPAALVRSYFASVGLLESVTLALDPTGQAMQSFGRKAFPAFFVVDKQGVVRHAFSGWGPDGAETLTRWIGDLLGVRPPKAAKVARASRAVRASKAARGASTAPLTTRGRRDRRRTGQEESISADERARRMGVEIVR